MKRSISASVCALIALFVVVGVNVALIAVACSGLAFPFWYYAFVLGPIANGATAIMGLVALPFVARFSRGETVSPFALAAVVLPILILILAFVGYAIAYVLFAQHIT